MENKTSKYFKYAIGEIVLVVIGILIALQINNWNENRKAKIEEVKILKVLFEDLKTAKISCQNQLDDELKNINTYEKALGSQKHKNEILNHLKVDSLFYRLLWGVGENPSVISAISEIQNSGNSNKIRNDSIRKQIEVLALQLNTLETIVKDRLTVQQLSIDKFSFSIQNFNKLIVGNNNNNKYGTENDYSSLLENNNILNAIAIKLDLSDSVIDERKKLMVEINKLIALLDRELNKIANYD
jgi:hypothetical protein